MRLWRTVLIFGWGVPALVSCRQPEILVYDVPKEDPGIGPLPVPTAGEATGSVLWEAPKEWKPLPPAPLRKAGFGAAGSGGKVEITVTAFPGDAGGLAANVNRWRGQLGLEPAEEAAIRSSIRRLKSPAGDLALVELRGEGARGDQGTFAAILSLPGESWFFKMSGDQEMLQQERPAFERFLKSVRAAETEKTSAPVPAKPKAASAAVKVEYQTPAGWQEQAPTAMRVASFSTAGGADISVVPLGPEAGSETDNVNRWRGQLQLAPQSEKEVAGSLQNFQGRAGTWRLVELSGSSSRITAAMLKSGQGTWFVKMTGPSGEILAQKKAFESFVQGLVLPGGGS